MIAWNEFLFALDPHAHHRHAHGADRHQLLMGQHSYEWNQIMR